MAYTHTRSRNLSTTRVPTLLPDIAELSPNLEPTRTPSPPRPTLRRVSVASFLSDGTIEIDGFGFDTISEGGDDNDIDALSLYGGESVYEDSVFGDFSHDRDGINNNGNNNGTAGSSSSSSNAAGQVRESQDLSRRAERILASAKRRLDRCGQNISKARNSIIMSPTFSPTAMSPISATPDIPELASIASVMEMDDVLGQFPVPRSRTESAPGARDPRWQKQGQTSAAATAGNTFAQHQRTASESAVSKGVGAESSGIRKPSAVGEQRDHEQAARSRSAQQMRSLRDQMKDLRGKISSLQEQAQRDRERDREILRRRQSVSSLRSNGSSNGGFYATPSLEEIRESRVLDIRDGASGSNEWEDMVPSRRASRLSRSSSRSSGTPKPTHPRNDLVTSPFSERHEDRFDAFSYDSLLIGNSFVHRRTLSNSSSASTATVLQAPHLNRSDSQNSISSYATATETPSPRLHHSVSPSTSAGTLRGRNPSPSTTTSSGVSSPATAIMSGLRPPPAISANDDGYHSAPQTPHPHPASSRNTPTGPDDEQSWYRDSILTESDSSGGYGRDPSPTIPVSHHRRNQPSYASSSSMYSQPSTITPYTNFVSLSSSNRNSRSSTPSTRVYNSGQTPVAITSSHRDSQTMILGGVVEGKDEVELKVGKEDRLLIEGVIETLGRVCCELETSVKDGGKRKEELRERLRGAMRVLEGWEGEMEMF